MNYIRAFFNWLMNTVQSLRTSWDNNSEQICSGFLKFVDWLDHIVGNTTRLMAVGIVFNIVATYFWPEFPERFPAIYGWFDGWLQFGEFAMRTALGGIYALFTGTWSEFLALNSVELREMWNQFVTWLSLFSF